MRVITGTLNQVQDYYFSLEGKIDRDQDGIEIFEIIYHGELAILIYKPKVKKATSQKSRTELNQKAQKWGWEVVKTGNKYQIVYGRNGVTMVESGTLRGIQVKLTKLSWEWQLAQVHQTDYDFLTKYGVRQ
jgi:hypothetical protein